MLPVGLINWWPLNGSLEDYIGKNDLVATTGFSSSDAGKIGRCYTASTNSASAQSKNSIMTEGNFSLCCWFKLTDVSQNPTAIVTFHDHNATSNIGINLGDNKLAVSIGYTDGSREWNARKGTTTISANVWYHAAVTYNHNTKQVSLYLNGVREYTGTLTKTVKFTSTKLSVNWWSTGYSGGYFTTGFYNDIRVYNHELSYKEVKEIAKAKMIHYACNESFNSKVRDNSGFRYHASLASGASPTLTNADSGTGSSSFLFANGSKQSNGLYQHFMSDTTIRIPEQGTLSYWIKYSGTENADNKYAVGFLNFCSMNNSGALGMIYYKDASNHTTTTANQSLRDGKWHMHTISWNKSTKAFKNYLDGTLLQSATVTDFTHAGTFKNFIVGSAWTTSYGGHSGYLDDIRVYATVLSDTDVKDLYQTKGSVAKNGKLFVNEIMETSTANMVTKSAYSANWTRIFYHNNKAGTVVFGSDKKELYRCNTTDKKSDLWALERFRDKDGNFELLLEYEGIDGYNRWKQTSNFVETTAITGYTAVACSWTSSGWGGLALSQDGGSTWIDGSPNSGASSWWYAIGCKTGYNGGIPGPNGTIATAGVSIWVRTDNVPAAGVNKKGILKTNEINEVDNLSMKTKTELNANWVRLFYHNSKDGTVLFSADKNEFLKCNTGDKISDLWALEQFRGKDGKFELLLQYQNTEGYNRWKQTSNFTKTTAIEGYEAVQCSWTSQNWGGLALSSTTNTWVDGSPGAGTWYYAIGARVAYSGGMPDAADPAETGWVEIWVRCDDINLFRIIKGGKCKATEFIEI